MDYMVRTALIHLRGIKAALPRIGWGLLLAVHVPAFFTVWSSILLEPMDPTRLSSGLALALTMALFVLKIKGVGFLKLRKRQHSFVVFCILTAIVHHGAIAPNTDDATLLKATAMVATVVTVRRLVRRAPTLFNDWLDSLRASWSGLAVNPAVAFTGRIAPTANRRRCAFARSVPRAPPM